MIMKESLELSQRITRSIEDVTSHLKNKNGDIRSMDYFYDNANKLYGNRISQLKEAKEAGIKIVGILCNLVPSELIRAAGAIPIRLCGGYEGSIPAAEKILPRVYCPLVKSTYGMLEGNSPYFDLIDVVVVPTTCDGKKKMAELLVKHKQTWVLEVPHTTITYQSREFWFDNLKLLKKQLETLSGNRISKKKLRESIQKFNKMRSLVHRLYETRKRDNIPIWGGDVLLVTNLAFYDDLDNWITATENLCLELEANGEKAVVAKNSSRILLTGTPMVLPAWKLIRVIEDIGGVIVADDICTGSKNFWDPVTPSHWTSEEMLIALADKYLMNTCPCFVPNTARIDRTLQFIKDFRVEGVVNYMLQGCHPFGAEDWRVRESVKNIDIPVFSLDTDYGDGDVGQIKIRMEAFMEMVRGKREEGAFF
jgi:benzoyl-CoA reductase/2-hydroxyglutaryl-CoA dehydratase subunit BcrC/BadD/HgdB